MTVKLVNTFSFNMLPEGTSDVIIKVTPITLDMAKRMLAELPYESYISHKATAEFLSALLEKQIEFRRENLVLEPFVYHNLLLAQIRVRLEEGKILSKEEIQELYDKGLLKLYLLQVIVYTSQRELE